MISYLRWNKQMQAFNISFYVFCPLFLCTLHHDPYLPGESPFWSKWMVSPDTPVKLVFIRNSSSLRPSMGRMASHKPWQQRTYICKAVWVCVKADTCPLFINVPYIRDRGLPAWHADHKPWSRWHLWQSPSWCLGRTDCAETLSLWRTEICS